MSYRKAISSLEPDILATIENECSYTPMATTHEPHPARIKLFYKAASNDNILILPFFFAQSIFEGVHPNSKRSHTFMNKQLTLLRQPRNEDQAKIIAKAERILSKLHSIILAVHCGFGKTYCAIYQAWKLGLKTAFLVHLVNNMTQLRDEILLTLGNVKVQILNTKDPVDPTADFYIVNPMICTKLGQKYEDPFAFVGTLIVDECHLICAEKMSMALTQFVPKYLIGLSATPKRTDGKDRVLDIYFGPVRLFKQMNAPFTVNRYLTGIVPEKENYKRGNLIWGSVLKSLAENEERNRIIVELVAMGPLKNNNVMILCKTKGHCTVLANMLSNHEEFEGDVTRLWGSTKLSEIDRDARVLIGTYSKCGVGFDHPKLDALVVAADCIEIEQYAGRIFRKAHETPPVIWDLVDNMPTLTKHWQARMRWYKSRGATIIYDPERWHETI